MQTESSQDVLKDIEATFGRVPTWVSQMPPAGVPAFWSLMKNFELAETKIPGKYKELIGLAVSGATRCRYCALFHTEGARLNGATDEEIAEASLMGSLTMMGSTFLNSMQADYDQFRRELLESLEFVKKQQGAQKGQPSAGKREKVMHA